MSGYHSTAGIKTQLTFKQQFHNSKITTFVSPMKELKRISTRSDVYTGRKCCKLFHNTVSGNGIGGLNHSRVLEMI